jgi:hypothetical protein
LKEEERNIMAMSKRNFSPAQLRYIIAKAAFETVRDERRAHDLIVDAECERLGINTPFGILPEGSPLRLKSRALFDAENAARKVMYEAAFELFGWATETALAKIGTEMQKAAIRNAVALVKKMAFVEKPFIELVDISLRLTV